MVTNPLVSDWPKPVQNFAPVFSCRRWMVGGASRPETCVRLGSRLPVLLGGVEQRWPAPGGKSERWVTRWRSMSRTASSASKRDTTTLAPPACMWASAVPSAVMWKSGSATR